MRSLIIDDDATSRALLAGALGRRGVVEQASSGAEGVMLLRSALALCKPFDLICLDIMMPDLDGQAVLIKIRTAEAVAKVAKPVAVLMTTSVNDGRNVLTAYQSGIAGYLVKPIDLKRLEVDLDRLKLGG